MDFETKKQGIRRCLEIGRRELLLVLDEAPEADVHWTPSAQTRSILQTLHHVIGGEMWWQDVIAGEAAAQGRKPDPEAHPEVCPDVPSALRRLEEEREKTLWILEGLTDAELDGDGPAQAERPTYTIEEYFHWLAQHDAWHAGQIAYVQTLWEAMGKGRE
jgi:uncharacterized damage-inducible protein DinB